MYYMQGRTLLESKGTMFRADVPSAWSSHRGGIRQDPGQLTAFSRTHVRPETPYDHEQTDCWRASGARNDYFYSEPRHILSVRSHPSSAS